MLIDTTLYFITDSTPYTEKDFLQRVQLALEGGVTLLQLREKNRTTREYLSLAKKVHSLTKKFKVPLIIDDRLDVALASGAEGVHLGQSDLPIKVARGLVGPDYIIGATSKTVKQAREAYAGGADYLGVGAIYPTTTKVVTVITPVATLKDICKAVPIPVNAIGGLNKTNLDVLKNSGISGLCVVSAIMHANNPKKEAQTLLKLAKQLKSS